ncbi:3-hydroxyacyl-CoA dehydrogenase family protein [Cognatishimia sp. WU-CL00825]|uniref:3-hydroxyacyl-CoA dehydrogenase family protein n=1 Tax=Cognatishimia sp. WU-CL00825 TaxID=3127658 RepID=UPI0033654003
MTAFSNVTVAGAGTMGHAIALVHAIGGCQVTLTDLSTAQLEWAGTRIDSLIHEIETLGLIKASDTKAILRRIEYQADIGRALEHADLLVEAIVEDAEVKKAFYQQVAPLMPKTCVLASNTSFLDVFPLLPSILKERSLIVHWYTPPYLIDLVDVVPAPDTPFRIAREMKQFLERMGKKPVILKKFVPGYIANNVQMAIESEVFRLLDAGVASVADIDDAVRYGLAQRLSVMGQFKKIDYTGLQVVHDIHVAGLYTPPSQPTATQRLKELLSEGASGVLSGHGFYNYSDADSATYLTRRDRKLVKIKQAMRDDDDQI